ncbi:SUZ domain [Dillenia turbinata]|uniref:SUZ domain n=1 Tax=Dillenia turbinata TaxID=194707 RepID=A0AAN8YWB8_9MAGN
MQVEELASLIKDNLPCKHLVLSMEEALISFLQDDTSSDEVLELEPTNPYNRLLLHRLADIFGFAHESVGEGDDRHLVLERCPETSIPSILVSDILWQYDEVQSPSTSHQLLRRKEASSASNISTSSFKYSFEEREAAYRAARQRIFSVDADEERETVRQKPRNVPVVAQRMIAHALGQRFNLHTQEFISGDKKESGRVHRKSNISDKDKLDTGRSSGSNEETIVVSHQKVKSCRKTVGSNPISTTVLPGEDKVIRKADKRSTNGGVSQKEKSGKDHHKVNMKDENLGAAKRMFAHALGLQSSKAGLLSK